MLDFDAYAQETRPIELKMLGGGTFPTKFYVNYLSESNLLLFDKLQDEADQTGKLSELQKSYAHHLSYCLSEIRYTKTIDGKKQEVCATGQEDKYKVLLNFSYLDLRNFSAQIGEDLASPLGMETKPSSDGPLLRDE